MHDPVVYLVVVDVSRGKMIGLDNFFITGEALGFERDEPGVLWESDDREKVGSRDDNWASKAYSSSTGGTDS